MVAAAPPAAPRQMTIQEMNRSVPPMRGTPATPGVEPGRARSALAQAAPPAGAAPAPAPAPAPSAGPAPANAGLPADAPKVSISGGVYSTDPTQRMLIVNGQVFNEGSELAPGVRLAEIKARTAILEFRGARYSVAY